MLEDRCVPTTLTVTSSADDVTQDHTLRYAVAHAQDGDTIQLTAAIKGPIVLTNGELLLSKSLTIESVPARTPTISGDGLSRIFEIAAGANVCLNNLGLSDGNAQFDAGGAILNFGMLTVSGSALSNNSADGDGGGICNIGTLTITGSTLSGNFARNGGGICNETYASSATVINCTLSGNTAFLFENLEAGGGGGICNFGSLTVRGSTLSNNYGVTVGQGGGGAIFNSGDTLAVNNCTLSGNYAYNFSITGGPDDFGGGGAICYFGSFTGGSVTVNDCTLSGNYAFEGADGSGGGSGGSGGGIFIFIGTLTATNCTVSGNFAYNFDPGFNIYGLSDGGGGIYNVGTLMLNTCTLSGNSAPGGRAGGGILNIGLLTLTDSTLSGNSAAYGGGIYNDYFAVATVTGSTLWPTAKVLLQCWTLSPHNYRCLPDVACSTTFAVGHIWQFRGL